MKINRTGTVKGTNDGRKKAVIQGDEDGAGILAPYWEFKKPRQGPSTLQVGERVTYTREELRQGPIARDIRRH